MYIIILFSDKENQICVKCVLERESFQFIEKIVIATIKLNELHPAHWKEGQRLHFF